ncbi:MAG TPA: hypothetical protein VJC20_02490 [Candidatus Paceibacterota bacterium]
MKETIGHCPYCTKILFKDASFRGEADFETNCRHCGKPIVVSVQNELVVVIKPKIQVNLPSNQVDKERKI